ncbi:MAG: UbiA family prenyltransferase [Actinomycetota bacterium]|nr:UbiA family prenyltransferase [Actinomycetota bacterium]
MAVRSRVSTRGMVLPLLRSAHLGPGLAVTGLTTLLASAARLPPRRVVASAAAVFLGQLSIGWGNDLVDAARDRQVQRADKPVASGQVGIPVVATAVAAALAGTTWTSLRLGRRAAFAHLALGVAPAHAYNLGLKSTPWSWAPYAVAFGALPSVVSQAAPDPKWAPVWITIPAAAIGVCAHVLNALPDLAQDDATGVRGLPHRLGQRRGQQLATGLLGLASIVVVFGPAQPPSVAGWAALAINVCLGTVAWRGTGRDPFRAAVGIALIDAGLLVAGAR